MIPSQSPICHNAMLTPFVDEVMHTQQTFRRLLTAMSEPATIMTLTQPVVDSHDNPVQQATQTESNAELNTKLNTIWAIAQTVLDSEVSVFVDNKLPNILAKSIRFFTGALVVDDPSQADYIIIDIAELMFLLERDALKEGLKVGTLEKPHTSATVLVLTDALSHEPLSESDAETHSKTESTIKPDPHTLLQVTGPGIQDARQLAIAGISDQIISHLQSNHKLFPCGNDWVFCTGNQLTALPRTSQVQVSGQDV